MPAELDLIDWIRARAAGRPSRILLGIGDDCALLRPRAGEDLAVTTDLSIAGRHFKMDWHGPEAVGHRTLARGLSDLAAMGARPLAAFLSLGLPGDLAVEAAGAGAQPAAWLDRFFDGLLSLAAATGTPLAGGDLAESPVFAADIVLIGAVRRNRALLRSGARAGDLIYVTGALGGAAAGLAMLAKKAEMRSQRRGRASGKVARPGGELEPALAAHLYPRPRLAQGQWLAARRAATAAIDISDGLSTDLAHLCEESGVAAEIDAGCLPIHPGASLELALHGGEDYELLFTAPPSIRLPRAIGGVALTRIGRMVRRSARRPQITMLTEQGRQPLEPRGWEHFTGR